MKGKLIEEKKKKKRRRKAEIEIGKLKRYITSHPTIKGETNSVLLDSKQRGASNELLMPSTLKGTYESIC